MAKPMEMSHVHHMAAALAAVAAAILGGLAVTDAAAQRPENLDALRQAALREVNETRQQYDLPPLTFGDALNTAAQRHAEDMLEREYYAHQSPEGESVMDRYLAAGGDADLALAENIGLCETCPGPPETEDVAQLHTGWMQSPEHRRNILAPGMERFGFGIASGDSRLYAVQTFAGPGRPRTAGPADDVQPIGPEARQALALDLINRERRQAGVPPLRHSPALSDSLRDQIPADALSELSLESLRVPLDRLSAQQPRWRSVYLMAGRCGGCGRQMTRADVRFFVNQWLDDSRFRDILLDPRYTHLGPAFATDGSGAKVGVAGLAGG